MTNTRLLRTMLAGNSVFSFACAAIMLIKPVSISNALGWTGPNIWIPLGALLALFAFCLLLAAIKRRPPPIVALAASLGDFLWVIGTGILVMVLPALMSPTGWLTAAFVALFVLVFGLGQVLGIDHLYRTSPQGHRLELEFNSASSAAVFWSLLADLGRISEFADGISESLVTSSGSAGVGTTRQCSDTDGNRWSERITKWQPGTGFDLEFDTTAPDFPFPFSEMTGGWHLADTNSGSRITIYWVVTLVHPFLAPLLLPPMEMKLRKDMATTVATMDDAAKRQASIDEGTIAPAA